MSRGFQDHDPYRVSMDTFAIDAQLSERLSFLRKVYIHVFGAILAMIGLEYLFFTTPIGGMLFSFFRGTWWLALIGFMAVSWFSQKLAFSQASAGAQYAGLGLYVVVQAIFVSPAIAYALMTNPDVIGQAAFATIVITGALTLFVVLSKKDFSFLGGTLAVVGIGLFVLGAGSFFFGYSLGLLFSVGVVVLMCGYILYETSLIMNHLPTTAHVAGALMIFGSMSEMFRHLIYLLSVLNDD